MKKHAWIMALFCPLPIVGLMVVRYMGIPLPVWTTYLLFLLCLLSHVVMMALMGHNHRNETAREGHHPETIEKQVSEETQAK